MAADNSVPDSATWHFDFDSVRAYRMNWDNEYAMSGVISGDTFNATREPIDGVLLTSEQIAHLHSSVSGAHASYPVAACFYPHHAFVFFDSHGNVVGSIDICFLCSNYHAYPDGFSQNWDLPAIAKLIQELGMPTQNPNWG